MKVVIKIHVVNLLLNKDKMDQIKSLEDTYQLLQEQQGEIEIGSLRADLIASTKMSSKNRFRMRPTGVCINDTVNNLIFPISYPPVDTGKLMLPKVVKQYIAKYQKQEVNDAGILPWHFVVEFYDGTYTLYNTRPIDMVFPFTSKQVRTKMGNLINIETDDFINDDSKDIQQYIHVLVIGNTSLDVYTRDIYEKIGRFVIGPISRKNKLPGLLNQTTFLLNIGHKFNGDILDQYIR